MEVVKSADAAAALREGNYAAAIRLYARLIAEVPEREALLGFNLALARRRYRAARREEALRVGVCGWRLSDNSAGRAQALADLYGDNVEMFGALYKEWGEEIWPPLRNTPHPYHLLKLEKRARFPARAFDFVLEHPFDLVHISKPRMPNIIFGLLYKLLWGARVIVDVDDEDLGGIGAETAAGLEALPRQTSGKVKFEMLGGKEATRVGTGLWDIFDGVTVSNSALQRHYGGIILPHARPAERFTPSPERKRASRERFGVSPDKKVVLFFGTPRRHKGLMETALALRQLGRRDVCFVVAGAITDTALRTDLEKLEGIEVQFLPVQPYEDLPDVVALGDICILLQDPKSLLAQYQLPAKLIDALAMGLLVFVQPTYALEHVIERGAVVPVTAETLPTTLAKYLDDTEGAATVQKAGRELFLREFQTSIVRRALNDVAACAEEIAPPHPSDPLLSAKQREVFEELGSWHSIFQYQPIETTTLGQTFLQVDPPVNELSVPQVTPTEIRGDFNVSGNQRFVYGWLTDGTIEPLEVTLKIDGKTFNVVADRFREDLKRKNIGSGNHGFVVTVPNEVKDGKDKTIVLYDKNTASPIKKKIYRFRNQRRVYKNFQGFLKYSMTNPYIGAPFSEEDKRCFATMEAIGSHLAAKAAKLSSQPLVSVIMPVYNRAEIVSDAINSVLQQSYRPVELIVVDDGSTDDTASVVSRYSDPRLQLIRQNNKGQNAARNRGLAEAKGDLITYLDSDNTWDKRYVAAVVGAFSEINDADLIYSGQLIYRSGSNDPAAIRYGHFNASLLENINYIDTNVIAHKREFLDRIQGFDETLPRLTDYDLILNAKEIARIYSVPFVLCNYFYDKAENTITKQTPGANVKKTVITRAATRRKNHTLAGRPSGTSVTVVIPSWNSFDDLRQCLESVYACTRPGTDSIVVVDNNSDHKVIRFLQKEEESGKIFCLYNKKNYGFTHAANLGIRESPPASDILLLNNDAVLQDGAIRLLQEACHSLPDAGMTVPQQILPAGTKTIQDHVPYADPAFDCDVNLSFHHDNIGYLPIFHDGGPIELTFAPFFCVYINRSLIKLAGLLDAEHGRHYRSDRTYSDFAINVVGKKIYYVPQARVVHKLQQSTHALRTKANTEFDLMFRKNQWSNDLLEELGFRRAAWDC